MSDTKQAILYSRSAVVQDWKCPRARFWNYEYLGRGISPATTALELFLGITMHDGLAALAHGLDIDAIVDAAKSQLRGTLLANTLPDDHEAQYFAEEQCALVEGLLRGYYKQVWPGFCKQYPEIVLVEQEVTYQHDYLTFMAKPDLVVRDTEGCLWYIEYKTTSTNKEQWINSWATAVQLHSSVRAVESFLGEKVTGVVVQGLYKGYVSYDKQQSPFCYGNHKPAEPPFIKAVWSYDWRAGLKKYPIWLKPGGVKEWVDNMPEGMLSQQFPQVPPIFINDSLVDTFFRQTARRELDIRAARINIEHNPENAQQILDEEFPQHFENCSPSFGRSCSYLKLCHGNVENPLNHGFDLRTSHHEQERRQHDASGS